MFEILNSRIKTCTISLGSQQLSRMGCFGARTKCIDKNAFVCEIFLGLSEQNETNRSNMWNLIYSFDPDSYSSTEASNVIDFIQIKINGEILKNYFK